MGGGEKGEPKKEMVGGFQEAGAPAERLPLEMCCGAEGDVDQRAVKNAAFFRQVNGISLVIRSRNNGSPLPLGPKSNLLLIHLPVLSEQLDRSHLLRSHVLSGAGMRRH